MNINSLSDFINALQNKDIEKADKINIVKEICNKYKYIKEILKYTYDPFYQYYIKSKFPTITSNNNTNKFNEEFWYQIIKPLLLDLNKRKYNTETYTKIIKDILETLNIEDANILKNIILKDLRIGFAAKSINNAINEELIPVSDCQLCKTYDPSMIIKNVDYWCATRKLNGLRGRYKIRDNNQVFLTREDLPLIGFEEIENELKYYQEMYDLSLIDGEIFTMNIPFQTIMSIARGEKTFDPEQKKLLKFNIFCVQRNNYKWKDTSEMVNFIINNIGFNNKYIVPLQYELIRNDRNNIIEKCIEYTNEGYEGIVLRDPKITWEPGKRNNHLLKYKLMNECDLEVKDVLYGSKDKKWENMITALYCEGIVRARKININNNIVYKPINRYEEIDDGDFIDIPIKVKATTSSLTDKERELLTNENINNIIGRIAEISFQTFTDKPNEVDGTYSLQFPVFQKFKDII